MNHKYYFIILLLIIFTFLLLNKSNFFTNSYNLNKVSNIKDKVKVNKTNEVNPVNTKISLNENFITNPIPVEKLHPRPYDTSDKPIDDCKPEVKPPPCRPKLTVQVYVHYIIDWTPTIKGKKMQHYLRSHDYKKTIHKNINDIWKTANVSLDLIDIYFEKATDNLAFYYPNDMDRSLELESLNNLLDQADAFKDRHLIRDTLINLTDPFNREKKAVHIYILPYIGEKTICRTINTEKYPIILAAQYNNRFTDKICRSCVVTPFYDNQKNMIISKEIAKHIGYVFGLLDSNNKNDLMSSSKNGLAIPDEEIDIFRYNISKQLYGININYLKNNRNPDISESKTFMTKNMNKADCYLLKNPKTRFRCLQHKYNKRKFWFRADPDSIPSDFSEKTNFEDMDSCNLDDKKYYMETLDKPFM